MLDLGFNQTLNHVLLVRGGANATLYPIGLQPGACPVAGAGAFAAAEPSGEGERVIQLSWGMASGAAETS